MPEPVSNIGNVTPGNSGMLLLDGLSSSNRIHSIPNGLVENPET